MPPKKKNPKGTASTQYNMMMRNDLHEWIVSETERRGLDNKAQTVRQIIREAMEAAK